MNKGFSTVDLSPNPARSTLALSKRSHAGGRGQTRRLMAVLTIALPMLGACSGNGFSLFGDDEDKTPKGELGFVSGFLGGVAADEPRAALIGRDVLSAGGSAADAATAVFFALSVTMPSSASLGGGGVCLAYDNRTKKTEALDFLPRAPRAIPAGTPRPSAVPGNVRGFFVLHAKYLSLIHI